MPSATGSNCLPIVLTVIIWYTLSLIGFIIKAQGSLFVSVKKNFENIVLRPYLQDSQDNRKDFYCFLCTVNTYSASQNDYATTYFDAPRNVQSLSIQEKVCLLRELKKGLFCLKVL